jgi:hypothetical protein
MMSPESISCIRIELHNEREKYFFVRPEYAARWHAWWAELFNALATLGPREVLPPRPDTGEPVETYVLTDAERAAVQKLLDTAPKSATSAHRTVRSALRRMGEESIPVRVTYFGQPSSGAGGGSAA